jgi:hypothetical protein
LIDGAGSLQSGPRRDILEPVTLDLGAIFSDNRFHSGTRLCRDRSQLSNLRRIPSVNSGARPAANPDRSNPE